ncbi:uncharacterized protein L969DRAFT_49761 [Mixia osmundae IAM 14324]|uniref:Xylanolytic transcriptional activator regulatory domain-containing protein n=1 Tax=Mixia osmundae (strain CBS 9802 / IAM 14324 / JCM 22182 / KY 12970) TaxID=764103 RepID=G7E7D5_MIXOS|nr:uncharacterized protein L969DRAFT_49761 [Mixia osmundae IAM 14324]KEI38904.1 hypothetical protein L969DRAFT_49761 [Mixia osmundae IAM 14324]GAA98745.1 hypothetical protein E5Q_05433 [Mixia osmundae IAM 14324]
MGSNSLISAWITLGLVVRRAQDLGCQRQNNQIWTTTVLRDQLRKRLFWTIYIADRKLSAVLGRPLALHDEDIDVELPLEIDDAALTQLSNEEISPATSSPNLITGLNCQVRLAQICGRALNTVYSIKRDSKKNNEPVDLKPIAGLDSALNEWLSNLPAHLQWDPKRAHRTFGVQSAECLLNYYELQILVHRDLLAPEQRTDIGYPSLAICTNAARSIAHLLEGTRRAQLLERCWLTAPFAAISALLILLVNRSSPSAYRGLSGSSLMEMPKLVDALGVLAQRTFVAQRLYAKIKVNMTMHGSGPDSEIKRAREASTGPPLQHEDVNDVPPRKRERQPELVVPDASSNTRDLRMDTFNRDPCFGLSSTSPTTATQASSAASQPSSAAFYEQMLSLSDFTPFSQTDTHHQPPVESGLTDTSTVGYGTGSRITTNLGHSQHGRFSTYQAPATPPLVFNNDWFDQPQYWANLASAYASPSQFNAYSAFQSPP